MSILSRVSELLARRGEVLRGCMFDHKGDLIALSMPKGSSEIKAYKLIVNKQNRLIALEELY